MQAAVQYRTVWQHSSSCLACWPTDVVPGNLGCASGYYVRVNICVLSTCSTGGKLGEMAVHERTTTWHKQFIDWCCFIGKTVSECSGGVRHEVIGRDWCGSMPSGSPELPVLLPEVTWTHTLWLSTWVCLSTTLRGMVFSPWNHYMHTQCSTVVLQNCDSSLSMIWCCWSMPPGYKAKCSCLCSGVNSNLHPGVSP